MSQSARKKVALVTGVGSATGIGFAVAKKLAAQGFAVVMTSTTDRIQERAEELRRHGATVLARVLDLTSYESAAELVAAAAGVNGRIDVLVNNAGATQIGVNVGSTLFASISPDEWHAHIARNLTTLFNVTRSVVPLMIDAPTQARLVRRADKHNTPGLTSALAACAERNASAPGIGEAGARARPRRSGILPRCGPAGPSIVRRAVGPTRFCNSSKRHPTSPSRTCVRCHILWQTPREPTAFELRLNQSNPRLLSRR
jgi:3-oxoacyl-[acyl-carrier protein] reductase